MAYKEIRKSINGYGGIYEISNHGNVYSIGRRYKNQNGLSEKLSKTIKMKQYKTTSGYMQVDLCLNGKYKKISVHRLVAIHFINNKYNLPEVNHIDCDKTNNFVENLEWCTSMENMEHARKNGRYKYTEKQRETARANGKLNKGRFRPDYSILSFNTRIDIIKYYESNKTSHTKLAEKYGVAKSTIQRILKNKDKYFERTTRS